MRQTSAAKSRCDTAAQLRTLEVVACKQMRPGTTETVKEACNFRGLADGNALQIPLISRQDGEIDESQRAVDIHLFVSALQGPSISVGLESFFWAGGNHREIFRACQHVVNVRDHESQPPGTRTPRNASVVAPSRLVGRGPRPETKRTSIG